MILHLYANSSGGISTEWEPTAKPFSQDMETIQKRFQSLLHTNATLGEGLLVLGLAKNHSEYSESLIFWKQFCEAFCEALQHAEDAEALRENLVLEIPPKLIEQTLLKLPTMPGAEFVSEEFLAVLWQFMRNIVRHEMIINPKSLTQILVDWGAEVHLAGRVHFHLVENRTSPAAPFAFMATYSGEPDAHGKIPHLPLRHALQALGDDNKRLMDLLSSVHACAKRATWVQSLLDSGKIFQPLGWNVSEAYRFLESLSQCEESGIVCRVPKWWGQRTGAKLKVTLGAKPTSNFGLNALMSASPELWIDGESVSEKELRALLDAKNGLALLKGRWVSVDRENLQSTLDRFEKIRKYLAKGLTLREAMQFAAEVRRDSADIPLEGAEVCFGDFLQGLMNKLRDPQLIRGSKPSATDFKATLRAYQQTGLDWVTMLHSLGLGACLADDMGLGKTVQVLAFLQQLQGKANKPSLLVVPTSLLPNWKAETEKFAPHLRLLFAHTAYGHKNQAPQASELESLDLVVTSYGMLPRLEWLCDQEWECLIADEAQALKNPGTRQAVAIRKIPARWRLAMTGTPVENRLGDLWSLFDFLNPGLLGSAKEFNESMLRIQKKGKGFGALRQVLKPYILRRMKTDKSIISDLPDKVEAKVYSPLSKAQVALYSDCLKQLESKLMQSDGANRRALVFTTLMQLKQICNHPDLHHGTNGFLESESGKLQTLRALCETIVAKREKILVFTQFQSMCEPLAHFLQDVFGRDGCVLHGGTSITARRKAVALFQDEPDGYVPWFVLSLKAGGTGLNLTGANHVVHFDRWWNPAVEDQATDRAFRIGQTRNVMVHKFVCRGTLEERIDQSLQEKRLLASEIVGDGQAESWITELDNQAILDMFRLDIKIALGD